MSIESQLAAYLKKLNGHVSLKKLFPEDFVQKHTKFKTIRELLTAINIVDQQTFDERDEAEVNAFIAQHTEFKSWDDMQSAAAKEFAAVKQVALRKGTWRNETFDSTDPFENIHVYLSFSAR